MLPLTYKACRGRGRVRGGWVTGHEVGDMRAGTL